MSRIAYVNGAYCPVNDARISIEERGFQFADAVYEVVGLRNGVMLERDGHLARLYRSLEAISIAPPMDREALLVVIRETVRRNRLRTGYVYIQITRGAAARDHVFPAQAAPGIIVSATALSRQALEHCGRAGVRVITQRDQRWGRCDIKTVNLLPNVLAKEAARAAGAQEAWLVGEDGLVREGATSNAWIVDRDGRLRTPPRSRHILAGVTRETVVTLAQQLQMRVDETAFSPEEAQGAREAFLTSASNGPVPIVAINGQPVGDGAPGPVARTLRDAYFGAHGLTA